LSVPDRDDGNVAGGVAEDVAVDAVEDASPGRDAAQALADAADAAVLLIDATGRQVRYANRKAMSLVNRPVTLPVDVDEWVAAAGLTDLDGKPLVGTASPLARAATEPISGEPVMLRAGEPSMRLVTGFALASGKGGALVVLLPMAGTFRERQLARIRDRALIASDISFTVSDPAQHDNPLIWCNPSFTKLTGYPIDEVLGQNCRFLQGENTDPAAVLRVRRALEEGRSVTEVLLNYRKDGSAFWNQVSISPVTDDDGAVVNFVGVQADVTERVLVQNERRAALAEAEEARGELRMLTEATTWMNESLDVVSAATRLAEMAVPMLADYCCVDLLDEPGSGTARRVAAKHRTPRAVGGLYRLGELLAARVGAKDPVSQVLSGEPPVLMADMPDDPDTKADDPDVVRLYRRLRPRSALVVPLRARGRVLGALTLCTERPYGRAYTQRDLHVAADLAGRAGLAMDNARLYAREHAAVETLQRSLLPVVSDAPGLTVATRYLVSTDEAEVGGDWYDLLPLPDGAVGLAIGDVVGHDLQAAAAMGQLRGVLRSYAWEGMPPGAVLDRCDQLVQGLDMAAMATAVYARLEARRHDGSRVLRYANAGHPPPLLRRPSGELLLLDRHVSPLIGAVDASGRGDAVEFCEPGSALLFYTDGLTDVPGHDSADRTELLRDTVAGAEQGDMERLCDLVLDAMASPDVRDDVALLAVHLDG
jgi:PAS domain S-box-containing protein